MDAICNLRTFITALEENNLLVCWLSYTDRWAAMAEGKKLVAYYLANERHIMQTSGVDAALMRKPTIGVGGALTGHKFQND